MKIIKIDAENNLLCPDCNEPLRPMDHGKGVQNGFTCSGLHSRAFKMKYVNSGRILFRCILKESPGNESLDPSEEWEIPEFWTI